MKKLPTVITREEFDKLMEEAKKQRDSYKMKRSGKLRSRGDTIQQYMIAMCLGFGAGMRISEIVGYKGTSIRKNKKTGEVIEKEINIPPLTYDQIENNMIRIIGGKGGKDRVTLLPIKLFRGVGITRDDLKKSLPMAVKRRSIQNFIENLTLSVLGRKKSFHKLRHGFGTTLAGANRPLHEIQMLMGHSRLDTTGIYLHANPKSAVDAANEVF